MVPFAKPGTSDAYSTMGANAARTALADARVPYERIEQAYGGRRQGGCHRHQSRRLQGGWQDDSAGPGGNSRGRGRRGGSFLHSRIQ